MDDFKIIFTMFSERLPLKFTRRRFKGMLKSKDDSRRSGESPVLH